METPTILMITSQPKIESWLAPMREAGIEAHIDGIQDALGSIRRAAPDLLIVDVSDGRVDAAFVIGMIRSDAEWRGLPIILFGCNADERERTAGLDAGADDFLAGPLSARELIARVRAVLRRGSRQ